MAKLSSCHPLQEPPVPGTQVIRKPREQPTASDGLGLGAWKVVLFNDDVHAFDLVIAALMQAAGLSREVAEMVAWEAHSQGQAVAKRMVDRETGARICTRLAELTRIPGRTTGVRSQVEPDDA